MDSALNRKIIHFKTVIEHKGLNEFNKFTVIIQPLYFFIKPLYIPVDYCSTGDMRLVGGEREAEGRLELCNSNRWGTVCGNAWTDNHTAVICRHLGLSDVIGGMHNLCNLDVFREYSNWL